MIWPVPLALGLIFGGIGYGASNSVIVAVMSGVAVFFITICFVVYAAEIAAKQRI